MRLLDADKFEQLSLQLAERLGKSNRYITSYGLKHYVKRILDVCLVSNDIQDVDERQKEGN